MKVQEINNNFELQVTNTLVVVKKTEIGGILTKTEFLNNITEEIKMGAIFKIRSIKDNTIIIEDVTNGKLLTFKNEIPDKYFKIKPKTLNRIKVGDKVVIIKKMYFRNGRITDIKPNGGSSYVIEEKEEFVLSYIGLRTVQLMSVSKPDDLPLCVLKEEFNENSFMLI